MSRLEGMSQASPSQSRQAGLGPTFGPTSSDRPPVSERFASLAPGAPQGQAPSVPLPHPANPSASSSPVILIVDDQALERTALVGTLSQAGYQVVEAPDGRSALARIKEGGIDLVVLDVNMPQMDGFEVCSLIRTQWAFDQLPVLFLSGNELPGAAAIGLNRGANDYVTKPFHKEELLARVGLQLKLRKPRLPSSPQSLAGENPQALGNLLQILATMSDPVLLCNEAQEILAANPAALATFDLKVPGELGFLMGNLPKQTLQEVFGSRMSACLETGLRFFPDSPVRTKTQVQRANLWTTEVGPLGDSAERCWLLVFSLLTQQEMAPTAKNQDQELVELMTLALTIWECSLGKSKVDLAQESGLWSVHACDGKLRTRTLDRYLCVSKLPAKPRWKEVVKTAKFVLSQPKVQESDQTALDQLIKAFLSGVR